MIHSTSIIDPKAEIDSSVEIGPYCTIGPNVKIGKNTKLKSHVVIEGWTTIGENNTFYPFSVIGAVPQDLKYRGERTELIIGNGNTIRESVTMNLGTVQGGGITRLGDKNLVMAYVHFGHDCRVGNETVLANNVGLAGHVIIEDFAIIGGQSGVSQFVRIGAHTYIGGQCGIERDIPPFTYCVGARPMQLKGTNLVGLKRRGFSSETISKINEAIHLWIRTGIEKEACLKEIEAQLAGVPEVQAFVDFIRRSDSGVLR